MHWRELEGIGGSAVSPKSGGTSKRSPESSADPPNLTNPKPCTPKPSLELLGVHFLPPQMYFLPPPLHFLPLQLHFLPPQLHFLPP
uniref:Uncharacterized protein n=1 Tax=Taeniopygia guttata TaxID=59729 RepID=A0A674HB47_TAEGU